MPSELRDRLERGVSHDRRRLLGAVASAALGEFGLVAVAQAATERDRAGPAVAPLPFARVEAGDLSVAYAQLGPADGPAVILLHGWPYDVHAFAEVGPALAAQGFRVVVPSLRGYGATRFLSADTPRNGDPVALAADLVALMDALGIATAVLAGFDWGARTAGIVAALWPERCRGLVSVSGYLISNPDIGALPLPPRAELAWWYQFYFATERGRAGYGRYRREFARLIWETASPRWAFEEATFARSAESLDNPDHVAVVVHNYRWRMGLAVGETKHRDMERRLASLPPVGVPTITMEGDANGAPHPEPAAYASKFTGRYEHRLVTGGIGHNLPQEAPAAFTRAVIDVSRW